MRVMNRDLIAGHSSRNVHARIHGIIHNEAGESDKLTTCSAYSYASRVRLLIYWHNIHHTSTKFRYSAASIMLPHPHARRRRGSAAAAE
eukprot:scaffold448094_cov17-Prasinocladus_malaysianus.AAC.3